MTDIEIVQNTKLKNISEIAKDLGLSRSEYELYGDYKAKLNLEAIKSRSNKKNAKTILLTAVNPTPAGEGKTTTNIGLSMAINKLGKSCISTLREPSIGPVFGIKGGAAGGGYSQVLPMEDINLHFTGDIHAITAAHNLIAAVIDNSLQHKNPLNINPKKISWQRVLDMNDRALRHIVIGLGKNSDGVAREDSFEITAASEIMAILCLARDFKDLKQRISKIRVAKTYANEIITVKDLGITDAVAILLKDAIKPNLVQTTENTPAIIHGGPFANIAHGCNSVIALNMARKLADYVVTEAGFGADLGAEKFFDIVSRSSGVKADAVVLVTTIRALKYNGGQKEKELENENLEALKTGFPNLKQHIENLRKYKLPLVVAINHFPGDSKAEIELLSSLLDDLDVKYAVSDPHRQGSTGTMDLAKLVIEACEEDNDFDYLYDSDLDLVSKIETVAKEIYRAKNVDFTKTALKKLKRFEKQGLASYPVCIAKTQYSFSDDPKKLIAPQDYTFKVRDVVANTGAGFIVVLAGEVNTMPGLPTKPAALKMSIDDDYQIKGLS